MKGFHPGNLLRTGKSLDLLPHFKSARITSGRQHHARARARPPSQLGSLQVTAGYVLEHVCQVEVHPGHDGLRFGVPQAAIELQNFRAGGSQHQPNVEESLIRNPLGRKTCQGWFHDGREDGLSKRLGQQIVGRVGSHPAGVRTLVPVVDAFVIARGHERSIALAVSQKDERELVALKSLFQKNALAAGAELVFLHHAPDEAARFVEMVRHQNAFAGAQTICLDHYGKRGVAQRIVRILGGFQRAVHFCVRNVVALQEFLRENLAAFKLRRLLRRSDDGPTAVAERVADAVNQRQFGPYDSEVRLHFFREGSKPGHVPWVNGHTFRVRGDPAVPRSTPDLFHARALLQLPHQPVLAPPTADHQAFHPWSSGAFTLDACSVGCQPNPANWRTDLVVLASLPCAGCHGPNSDSLSRWSVTACDLSPQNGRNTRIRLPW